MVCGGCEKESATDIFKPLTVLLKYVILHSTDTPVHHRFVECLPCVKWGGEQAMWIPAGESLGLCNRSARMRTGNTEAGNRLEREGGSKLIDWEGTLRSLEADEEEALLEHKPWGQGALEHPRGREREEVGGTETGLRGNGVGRIMFHL